jgi:hypothetical protein
MVSDLGWTADHIEVCDKQEFLLGIMGFGGELPTAYY